VRALVVCNPAARGGRSGRALPGVLGRLRGLGIEAEAHRTVSLEDARAAACGAAGSVDVVAAMGGDGVVGACAAGLAEFAAAAGHAGQRPAAPAALAVIPAGAGNDAARTFGIPLGDQAAAAALLPSLVRRRADLARVGDRHYLNVAGAGFDSEVNRLANERLARAPGRVRYVGALLAELAVHRPATFTLTLDDEPREVRAWFVVVANGPSYGGGMRIAPDARVDDGLLDVVVVDGALSRLGCSRAAMSTSRPCRCTASAGSRWPPTGPCRCTPTGSGTARCRRCSSPARPRSRCSPRRARPGSPGHLPAPSRPGHLPAPSRPGHPPAPSRPGHLPAPSRPGHLPAPSRPGHPAAPRPATRLRRGRRGTRHAAPAGGSMSG
jgi:diacylglycerol kinase (ATP)